MTGQGLLQMGLFLSALLLLVKPLGAYMAAVFEGRRTFMSPLLEPVERLIYRVAGRGSRPRIELAALRLRRPAGEPARPDRGVRVAAPAGRIAAQSAGVRRRIARFVVQHGGQLRHQHELAGLCRRSDHELPDADARARRAEFPLGGLRNRGAGGADPRVRAP